MRNTDDDDQRAPDQGSPNQPQLSGLALAGLGFAVACALVAGLALGWFLDDRLGTAPVFILVGMASGILLGVLGAYREMRRYLSD
jgi:F0F1-type ATP synthase assembly protein I